MVYALKSSPSFLLVVLLATVLPPPAESATLSWDSDANSGNGQTDGAGAWKGANQWLNAGVSATWASGSDAVFGNGGTGDAVTLASGTTVNSLTFNSFSGSYTLGTAGQTITLSAPGITMNAGAGTVIITSPFTTTASGFTLNSSTVALTLDAAATLSSGFTLNGGTARLTFNTNPTALTLKFLGTGGGTLEIAGITGTFSHGSIASAGGTNEIVSLVGSTAATYNFTGLNSANTGGIVLANPNATVTCSSNNGSNLITNPFGADYTPVTFGVAGTTLTLLQNSGNGAAQEYQHGLNSSTYGFGGTVVVSRSGATGGGLTHKLSGPNTLGANTITVSAANFNKDAAYGLTLSGATALDGSATFQINNNVNGGGAGIGTLTVAGIAGNGNRLTLKGAGNFVQTSTFTGTGSSLVLDSIFTGTANLSQANTFGGGTTVNGGYVVIGNAVTWFGSGMLTLNGGKISPTGTTARTIDVPLAITGSVSIGSAGITGSLTFNNASQSISGSPTITLAGAPITFGAVALEADSTTTFTGSQTIAQTDVWSGSGSSVALGSGYTGTATLSQPNTYSGNTAINGGTLKLTGSINNSAAISIAAGATFDVSSYVTYTWSSSTSLSASGTGIVPGSSAATIKAGTTVDLGTQPITLTYDGTHPALYISPGALSLGGNIFTINGARLVQGTYVIVEQQTGSITSTGSNTVKSASTAIPPGATGSIRVVGSQVLLDVSSGGTTLIIR